MLESIRRNHSVLYTFPARPSNVPSITYHVIRLVHLRVHASPSDSKDSIRPRIVEFAEKTLLARLACRVARDSDADEVNCEDSLSLAECWHDRSPNLWEDE